MSYKVICRQLSVVLGLEVPEQAKWQTESGCHKCQAWGHLVGGMGHAKVRCCSFIWWCEPSRDFRKAYSMSKTGCVLEKPLEAAWVGPQVV